MNPRALVAGILLCLSLLAAVPAGAAPAPVLYHLVPVATYNSSSGGVSTGTEIVSFDPKTERAYSTNAAGLRIDVTSLADPAHPEPLNPIDLSPYGSDVQSVDVHKGIVAAAMKPLGENATQQPGLVVLFDKNGQFLRSAQVGALPDMITFTPDGKRVLTANEGEPFCEEGDDPADAVNPEGSVSIVRVADGKVQTADFRKFDQQREKLLAAGVRLNWPGATVAEDMEPEYIATDGLFAWVTLQENNAIAKINTLTAKVAGIFPLGTKDHSLAGAGLDPSDRDGPSNAKSLAIVNRPVDGLFMPDGIALLERGGDKYLLTANEGDARDYDCFGDEARVADLVNPSSGPKLDPAEYSGALVGNGPDGIGRLTITSTDGDRNGDGLIDRATAYGARSFSVWSSDGDLVFDSGDALEQLAASRYGTAAFNSDGEADTPPSTNWDTRSDNKGPEPESVTVGKVGRKFLAFVGLERLGGVAVFDVSKPQSPVFESYSNPRLDGQTILSTDRAPEGLHFVSAAQSPNGVPLLLVSNEISGNVRVFEIRPEA